MGKTLFEKIWDQHVVKELPSGEVLLYIDRHLVHEVTSPQAFEGLAINNRSVRHPELTFATTDHNVPTDSRIEIKDPIAKTQVSTLQENCKKHNIRFYGMDSDKQGVVHIIGPEQGITLPGTTIVCGDSHTATHGGFGSIAFGIGTSEVEHVLATQTLRQKKPKQYKVEYIGKIPTGVTAKDLVLELIGRIGAAGGTGCAFEFCGPALKEISMEGRLTICNMAIEGGARCGLIAPDQTTYDYITAEDRPFAPKGEELNKALEYWKSLYSDHDAVFDKTITINVEEMEPNVTWGTSPGMVVGVNGKVPEFDSSDIYNKDDIRNALNYMGLQPGTAIKDINIDAVFITRPTSSIILYSQMLGRGLRGPKVGGNKNCILYDVVDNINDYGDQEDIYEYFDGYWN